MRWRNALMAGGAAVGAAAVFNRLVSRGIQPLENLLGGHEGWFDWRGRRISYTRHGDGAGLPLLLVHGIGVGNWSYEWRFNVDALASAHVVYTIDLLGFGRSDCPNTRYSARLYMRLIDDFAREVVGAPCALVASSLSAAYTAALGARDPGRFPALVLIEPVGLMRLNDPPSTAGDVGRAVMGAPVVGTAVFNALVSERGLRLYFDRTFVDRDYVTDEVINAYYRSAHQPGARYAAAAFLSGHLNVDVRSAIRRLTQPALLVWGEQAPIESPVEDVRGFRSLNPDLELAILDPAGLFPHAERAEEFNELVLDFLARATAGAAHSDPGLGRVPADGARMDSAPPPTPGAESRGG